MVVAKKFLKSGSKAKPKSPLSSAGNNGWWTLSSISRKIDSSLFIWLIILIMPDCSTTYIILISSGWDVAYIGLSKSSPIIDNDNWENIKLNKKQTIIFIVIIYIGYIVIYNTSLNQS